jgi:predicted ATP-dependent endonuclease of OLD family
MKLERFKVTNFRSIVDSGWVSVSDIAVIVGKNESGKTSLLKALWKFNPFEAQPYSLDREWPRGNRKDRSPDKVVIETEFEFDESEMGAIAKLHESPKEVSGVRIARDYKGSFFHTFLPEQPESKRSTEWVVSLLNERLGASDPASAHFKSQYSAAFTTFIDEVKGNGGTDYAIKNLPTLKGKLAQFVHPSHPEHQTDLNFVATLVPKFEAALKALKTDTPYRRAVDLVHEWLPTFVYMDDYRIFAGEAKLDQVKQRIDQNIASEADYTIRLIMQQAGLDLNEEVKKAQVNDREQRMLDMNDASVTLTNEIAERWRQKRYEVQFSADGFHFITFVKDADSKTLVPLEERSKGFQWFFSFDMLLMTETKGKFENCVILLDEPGLHLHAAAQRDLLQRMKAYAKGNQLVYSTHLPFMIDFTRLDNIYVCEDKGGAVGVRVHQDWASADKDARFTLQAALGLSWSQSLFVGHYNLVVEGITDFWYLTTVAEMFREAGESSLDEELVVTPAGGASKVAYVGTILRGQELNVAVLLDSDAEGTSAYEQLVHNWILEDRHVFLLGKVLGESGTRCIEDLFDESMYVSAVEESYKAELSGKKLTLPARTDASILDRVEDALKKVGVQKFNKGRPAKLLMRRMATMKLADLSPQCAERFRTVFKQVNSTVAKWRSS